MPPFKPVSLTLPVFYLTSFLLFFLFIAVLLHQSKGNYLIKLIERGQKVCSAVNKETSGCFEESIRHNWSYLSIFSLLHNFICVHFETFSENLQCK